MIRTDEEKRKHKSKEKKETGKEIRIKVKEPSEKQDRAKIEDKEKYMAKKRVLNTTKFIRYSIAALIVIILIITSLLVYIAKSDTSLDTPDAFVQNQTSKVIEKKYFTIVLNRIPLSAQAYDPANNELNYTLGIDASQDRLNFGVIPINAPAKKALKLSNTRNGPVKVRANIYGNISKYISLEDNNFILESTEKKDIMVHFTGAESQGTYKGELDVMIIIPTSSFAQKLLMFV